MDRWKQVLPIALGLMLGPTAAIAGNFEVYWNIATHAPGATTKEYPKATVITDEKNFTVYVFTKPDNPAHPGVIVRKLVNEKDGAYFDTDGYSDGPDSAQLALKTWMANPLQ